MQKAPGLGLYALQILKEATFYFFVFIFISFFKEATFWAFLLIADCRKKVLLF